jgi:hypothetical protein
MKKGTVFKKVIKKIYKQENIILFFFKFGV